jgi:O-antigen/teichoic acid export membrane protein
MGNVLRIILAIASVPILVRSLGLRTYGHLSVLVAIINLGTLAEMGLGAAATVHLAGCLRSREKGRARLIVGYVLSLTLALSALAALAILACTPLLERWLFADVRGKDGLGLHVSIACAALAVVARTCFQTIISILQGARLFTQASALQTVWFYLMQGGLITAALFKANLSVLSAVVVATSLFSTIVAWHYMVRHYGPVGLLFPQPNAARRSLVGTATNIGVINLANSLFSQADKIVVGSLLSATLTGIYSTFSAIASQVNIIASAVSQPTMAYLVKSSPGGQPEQQSTFNWAFELTTIVVLMMAGGLILTKEYVMPLLFPGIPAGAYPTLGLLALSIALFSLNAPAYYALQALGQSAYVRKVVLWSGALTLGSMCALGRLFGLEGAAAGTFAFSLILLLTLRAADELRLGKAILWEMLLAAVLLTLAVVVSDNAGGLAAKAGVMAAICSLSAVLARRGLRRVRLHPEVEGSVVS